MNDTVQSLDRGLNILKMLAEKGPLTASSVAKEMKLHQTSASRMLSSLQKAGFVKKPSFHSFALDYGALLFGGIAMSGFPIVNAAVEVCEDIYGKHGLGVAVTTLLNSRLLYFARIWSDKASISMIDDSSFPVHLSSSGLALARAMGKREEKKILKQSMANNGENECNLEFLIETVEKSFLEMNFLYLENFANLKINSAAIFEHDNRKMALSVFSHTKKVSPNKISRMLNEGIASLKTKLAG